VQALAERNLLCSRHEQRSAQQRERDDSEHRDGELLIPELPKVIEGRNPAFAAYALVSTLASLAASHAANPAAQGQRLGELLLDAVNPPVNRLTH
jgi:hypothetical protein